AGNGLAGIAAGAPWSAEEEAAEFARLEAAFPVGGPTPSPHPGAAEDRRPIFVVGLPRSGTTLVEQVLAAHDRGRAMGETPLFPHLFHAEAARAGGLDPTRLDWAGLAQDYLRETDFLAGDASVRIDKLPENAIYAGPIQHAFPDATIVLVTREPMDVLF